NGAKALEMRTKRLQRDIDRKDDEIKQLKDRESSLYGRLSGRILDSGFRDAVESYLKDNDLKLRKGALALIRKDLGIRGDVAGDFEVREDDDGEFEIVHKETGENISEVLAKKFDSEDYALFLDEGEKTTGDKGAAVRGTARTDRAGGDGDDKGKGKGKDKDKGKPSYSEAYKARMTELESAEGIRPAMGLARRAKS